MIHLKGYGIAEPSGRAVTPQTPFILNSISKSFAALAVMQLVEQGRIELEAPVQRYLPWFQVADNEASAQITVRHLLNQTSGLPESASYADLATPARNADTLEQRVRRLRTTQLNRPVGSTFEYTDANYDVPSSACVPDHAGHLGSHCAAAALDGLDGVDVATLASTSGTSDTGLVACAHPPLAFAAHIGLGTLVTGWHPPGALPALGHVYHHMSSKASDPHRLIGAGRFLLRPTINPHLLLWMDDAALVEGYAVPVNE